MDFNKFLDALAPTELERLKVALNERGLLDYQKPVVKQKSIEDRRIQFSLDCQRIIGGTLYYNSELYNFISYWTEPNKSKNKMRFELQKTWDIKRRWNTWQKNAKKFNNKEKGSKFEQLRDL